MGWVEEVLNFGRESSPYYQRQMDEEANKESERQYELQSRLNENAAGINYKYGEQSAANAHERTQQLIADQRDYDSPEAVRSRLEAAGMNPALMYGGASAGGGQNIPSGAQGATGGASAGQAPQGMTRAQLRIAKQGQALQAMSVMANIAAVSSQAKLNEKNAELAEAEADKKRGVDTDKILQEISLLKETIEGTKLQSEGQRFINQINETNADIANRTKEYKVEQAQYECDTIYFQMMSLSKDVDKKVLENEITKEQKETIINTAKAQYVAILHNIAYTQATTGAQNKLADLYGQQYWESYSRENLNYKEALLTDERRAEIDQMVDLAMAQHGLEILKFEHGANIDYQHISLEQLRMNKELMQSIISGASNLGGSWILSGGLKPTIPTQKPYTGIKWGTTSTVK